MDKNILTSASRWDIVEDVIEAWIKRHPLQWEEFRLGMAARRAGLADEKFAEGTEKTSMRALGSFPGPATSMRGKKKVTDDLMKYLEKVLPEFWEKSERGTKTRVEFFRRFPTFRLPEKI